LIRSYYELKIITALVDEKTDKYNYRIIQNGKGKMGANHKLGIKKKKAVEQLFAHFDDYRANMDSSRVERRLYTAAFENLESHYTGKYKRYVDFSLDIFVVRVNALKGQYVKLHSVSVENLQDKEFYKLIEAATEIEKSAGELLKQMNVNLCSSEKLQPLHIVELYYTIADYFHPANSLSSLYKHELSRRLKPELTRAIQNFNFTLARELLAKIRELSY
tara:strand:- start:137 stop:793 length:657 start_codon:yes stop_codon:yes gene_type:complete